MSELSTREVARRFSVDRNDVVYAIRTNRLRGTKLGWCWFVNEKDLPKKWEDLGIIRRGAGSQ